MVIGVYGILLVASVVAFYWFNLAAEKKDTLKLYLKTYSMLVNGLFHLFNILVLAALTCLIMKCRNEKIAKCIIIPCTLLLQLLIVAYFYLATLMFFTAEHGESYLLNNCEMLAADGKLSNASGIETELFDAINRFDDNNNEIINSHMCSSTCHCIKDSAGQSKYELYGDHIYSKYNRTKASMIYDYKQNTTDVLSI